MAKIRTAAARKLHQSFSDSSNSSDDDAPVAKSSKSKPGPKSSKPKSDRNSNSSSETPRRGRGRPLKTVAKSNGRSKSYAIDSSDDEAPVASLAVNSDSDNDTQIKSKVSPQSKPGPKSMKMALTKDSTPRGRGRPPKNVAKRDESSEDEAEASDSNVHSDEHAQIKEPTSRGRGRPPKNVTKSNERPKSKRDESSEDEAEASDTNVHSDEHAQIKEPTSRGRGRPPKNVAESNGRPKSKRNEISDDDAQASDSNVHSDEDVQIKEPTSRGRGRPPKNLAKSNGQPKSKRNNTGEDEAQASDSNVNSDEDAPIRTPRTTKRSSTQHSTPPESSRKGRRSLGTDKSNDGEASSDDESSKIDDHLDGTSTESPSKVAKRKADSSTAEKSSRGPKGHWSKKQKKADDEDRYEVEEILDHKVEDGRKYFLIRWKGYGPDVDSWEKQNTISCPALLTKYYEKHPDARLAVKPRNKRKKVVLLPIRPLKIDQEADYDSDNWNKDEDYEVEKVLDVRYHRDDKREFLIRWKGYSSNSDTWEPEEHLSCEDLIQKFMDKLERIKSVTHKELRPVREPTKRFTLMAQSDARRLSKRHGGRQRAVYYECDE